MSALRTVTQRAVRQLTATNLTSSSRVVSTSPRKDQGVIALNPETATAAIGECPFRHTFESFQKSVRPEIHAPQVQETDAIKPFEKIPGPKGLPLIGTLWDYIKKDGLKFSKMFQVYQSRSEEFGDVYQEQIGDFKTMVVSSPEEYSKLIHSEGKYPYRIEMQPFLYYRLTKNLGPGIVSSQGEEWRQQRSLVNKKLLNLKEVSKFSSQMGEVAEDFVQRLDSVRDSNGEVQLLEKEIFKWAMESIGTIIFEDRLGCLQAQPSAKTQSFIHHLEGFFQKLQPLMYNLPVYKLWATKTWKQFENHLDTMMEIGNGLVEKKITEMQSNTGSKSELLNYLLNTQKLSSKEATDVATELLVSAVETVSTTTTWCMYTLAKNPAAQERLYKELQDAKANNGGEPLSADQLCKLPFVKAVLKETLRLYPITYATSRKVETDMEIGGYNVPAGTHVQANVYGMYHNGEHFDRPEEFVPERWLPENSHKMDATVKAMANLVWGHGARMCIGRRVAEQELYINLSKIVEAFQLSYHHEDVEPVLNTVMTPDRPLLIKFTPRQA